MGFEEAQAAMAQTYGDKISPDRLNPTTGKAPDSGSTPPPQHQTQSSPQVKPQESRETQSQDLEGHSEEEIQEAIEDLFDLETVNKKIKLGDETFESLDDLKKSLLRHKDYTKKTQAISEIRKKAEEQQRYVDNFQVDLEKVLKEPDKWEEQFRKVYPENFQKFYDWIKQGQAAGQPMPQDPMSTQQQPVHPQMAKILQVIENMDNRLSSYEQQSLEAKMGQEEARLENIFNSLHKKYDLGDEKANKKLENLVISRAQHLDKDPTDRDLEKFFKEEFEELTSLAKTYGEKQFRSQKTANEQAKDTASGGGVATSAPVVPKTFKEARKAFEDHLARSR